jgi:hypothetical protein
LHGPCGGFAGDVIGVVLNRAERTIFYTKNGESLPVAFEDVKADRLFPVVGLRTPGEEVRQPFLNSHA